MRSSKVIRWFSVTERTPGQAATRAALRATWARELDRITIGGGTTGWGLRRGNDSSSAVLDLDVSAGEETLEARDLWVEELTQYQMIWITYLGAGLALRQGRHVAVDLVGDLLPPGLRRGLRIFIGVAIYFGVPKMVTKAIESLGGDPTSQTPCADVAGVEAMADDLRSLRAHRAPRRREDSRVTDPE